jgi:CheY-like chemotaxis protein
LRVALDDPPAALIVDLIMPRMDGLELIRRLRELPNTRTLPVIVWTEKDLSADERARVRASAEGLIAKGPGGIGALVEALRPFLSDRSQVPDGG